MLIKFNQHEALQMLIHYDEIDNIDIAALGKNISVL